MLLDRAGVAHGVLGREAARGAALLAETSGLAGERESARQLAGHRTEVAERQEAARLAAPGEERVAEGRVGHAKGLGRPAGGRSTARVLERAGRRLPRRVRRPRPAAQPELDGHGQRGQEEDAGERAPPGEA